MKKVTNTQKLVVLRALEPTDIDILYEWENNHEIWKVSNTIAPFSKYILTKYVENSHLDIYQTKQLRLMIDIDIQKENKKKTVGTIDLFDFDPYHLRAGVGILIGDISERRKGYARLALVELISYAFNVLQLHQLYCNITENNDISIQLFKDCGFVICGKKQDWIKKKKGFQDEYLLQLINRKQ